MHHSLDNLPKMWAKFASIYRFDVCLCIVHSDFNVLKAGSLACLATGIRQRHILANDESLGHHAATAARQALEMGGVAPEDIDLIILSTSTPDDLFGSACQVPESLSLWGDHLMGANPLG